MIQEIKFEERVFFNSQCIYSHHKACLNHCQFNNFSKISASSNTGTFDFVPWPLKRKLVESMECTDARFMQQSVRAKFQKVYARQNQKINLIHLHIHLVETIALILHSKVVFKKLFWLKLFVLKNTLHALNPLIPRGKIRLHMLK